MKFQNPILNFERTQMSKLQRAITRKNAKGNNSKKTNTLFFKFSPDNLLIILYQMSKFEATSCNSF